MSRAEVDLVVNRSYKAEIDARQDNFEEICEFGQRLLRQQPQHAGEVGPRIEELRQMHDHLNDTWDEVQHALQLQRDALQYAYEVDAAHAWLATRDALMTSSTDPEDSADIHALMHKHAELEASVSAQDSRFASLRRLTQHEAEVLDQQRTDAFFRRFQEEDAANMAEQAERERARQEAQEAARRRAAEVEQQMRQQEEEDRRQRAQLAAQAAAENEARVREMANAILERDRCRSMALNDALVQARQEAAQRVEAQRREQAARQEREKRAEAARERARQAAEEVRNMLARDDFLPTPSTAASVADGLRRASVAASSSLAQRERNSLGQLAPGPAAAANGPYAAPDRRGTVAGASAASVRPSNGGLGLLSGSAVASSSASPTSANGAPRRSMEAKSSANQLPSSVGTNVASNRVQPVTTTPSSVFPPAVKAKDVIATAMPIAPPSPLRAGPPQGFGDDLNGAPELPDDLPPPPPPDVDSLPPLPADMLPPVDDADSTEAEV